MHALSEHGVKMVVMGAISQCYCKIKSVSETYQISHTILHNILNNISYNISYNRSYNILYNISYNRSYNILYNRSYNRSYNILYNISYNRSYNILYNILFVSHMLCIDWLKLTIYIYWYVLIYTIFLLKMY